MSRLKLDENLSRHLKAPLSALGHDVQTVADQGLLSEPDPVVAEAARTEGRMLLTLDVGLADLRKYAPGSHPGIVLFRPRTFGPLEVNRFVEDSIRELALDRLTGCVVLVEPSRVRLRRPPS